MMLEIFLSGHKEMTWSTELILAANPIAKTQATFMNSFDLRSKLAFLGDNQQTFSELKLN